MWPTVFSLSSSLALLAWAVLVLAPRKPAVLAGVLYLGIGLLCLIYSCAIIGLIAGVLPGGGAGGGADFTSIQGVKVLFASDAGATVGWVHYLAFDLFVGLWMARDADAKGFSRWVQAPVLLATFMVGPLGLFIWLLVRERRARATGRWT